jgi:hypothetical protein
MGDVDEDWGYFSLFYIIARVGNLDINLENYFKKLIVMLVGKFF